jgi:hypothetical protein
MNSFLIKARPFLESKETTTNGSGIIAQRDDLPSHRVESLSNGAFILSPAPFARPLNPSVRRMQGDSIESEVLICGLAPIATNESKTNLRFVGIVNLQRMEFRSLSTTRLPNPQKLFLAFTSKQANLCGIGRMALSPYPCK